MEYVFLLLVVMFLRRHDINQQRQTLKRFTEQS